MARMVSYCFALDILFAVMNWYKPKTWLPSVHSAVPLAKVSAHPA
jgi:hypothetical protein